MKTEAELLAAKKAKDEESKGESEVAPDVLLAVVYV